jgi:acyl-CoA thioester hydrolase
MTTKRSLFRHTTQIRVRNYEVDWQGIVHNANYLLYFEVGRIEYLKALGVPITMESIVGDSRVVVARNEINYRSSALFDHLLAVHTRISYINESSFAFEGLIEDAATGMVIADNLSVHVWLDGTTGAPKRVGDDFRSKIRSFEGENVSIRQKEAQ